MDAEATIEGYTNDKLPEKFPAAFSIEKGCPEYEKPVVRRKKAQKFHYIIFCKKMWKSRKKGLTENGLLAIFVIY